MPSVVQVSSARTEPKASRLSYTQIAETKHDREYFHSIVHLCALLTCRAHVPVDWADLVTLDLARFDEPGGKEALARQLFEALQTIGFFYIVNFGLAQEEVDRQFAIGKAVFDLPTEEKLLYRADLENGGYNGYKPLGLRVRSQFSYKQRPRDLVNRLVDPPCRKFGPASSTTQRSSTSPSLSQHSRENSPRSSMPTGQR